MQALKKINLKQSAFLLMLLICLLGGFKQKSSNAEWEILFDGESTDKWKSADTDTFPATAWGTTGGKLFVKDHVKDADIITREVFTNFQLEFDFNLTEGANSGVKYLVAKIKNNNTSDSVWNGPEYQIIDDYNHPAVKNNKDPEGSTAALYLVYAPSHKKLFAAGEWNKAKIVVEGKHVEHWLNGVKVVSYKRGSEDFRKRMAVTKFKDYDRYGELPGGHIMLTDHDGDKVYFRNIRIRRL